MTKPESTGTLQLQKNCQGEEWDELFKESRENSAAFISCRQFGYKNQC